MKIIQLSGILVTVVFVLLIGVNLIEITYGDQESNEQKILIQFGKDLLKNNPNLASASNAEKAKAGFTAYLKALSKSNAGVSNDIWGRVNDLFATERTTFTCSVHTLNLQDIFSGMGINSKNIGQTYGEYNSYNPLNVNTDHGAVLIRDNDGKEYVFDAWAHATMRDSWSPFDNLYGEGDTSPFNGMPKDEWKEHMRELGYERFFEEGFLPSPDDDNPIPDVIQTPSSMPTSKSKDEPEIVDVPNIPTIEPTIEPITESDDDSGSDSTDEPEIVDTPDIPSSFPTEVPRTESDDDTDSDSTDEPETPDLPKSKPTPFSDEEGKFTDTGWAIPFLISQGYLPMPEGWDLPSPTPTPDPDKKPEYMYTGYHVIIFPDIGRVSYVYDGYWKSWRAMSKTTLSEQELINRALVMIEYGSIPNFFDKNFKPPTPEPTPKPTIEPIPTLKKKDISSVNLEDILKMIASGKIPDFTTPDFDLNTLIHGDVDATKAFSVLIKEIEKKITEDTSQSGVLLDGGITDNSPQSDDLSEDDELSDVGNTARIAPMLNHENTKNRKFCSPEGYEVNQCSSPDYEPDQSSDSSQMVDVPGNNYGFDNSQDSSIGDYGGGGEFSGGGDSPWTDDVSGGGGVDAHPPHP